MTSQQKPLIILIFAMFLLIATAYWWKITNADQPETTPAPVQPVQPVQPTQPVQPQPPQMPPIRPLDEIDPNIDPPDGPLPEELPFPPT